MTRYQMLIVETDDKDSCIDFYSTDAALLSYPFGRTLSAHYGSCCDAGGKRSEIAQNRSK